jgi:hypothetical protein
MFSNGQIWSNLPLIRHIHTSKESLQDLSAANKCNIFLPGLIQNRILIQSRIRNNLKVLNLHHWLCSMHKL